MKLAYQFMATIVVCFLLELFLPWWSLAIGACAVAYFIGNKGFVSFLVGFIAIVVLWVGMALYIDQSTHSILTEKVNRLLPLNSFLLMGLIGGLVGGFGALTGALAKAK